MLSPKSLLYLIRVKRVGRNQKEKMENELEFHLLDYWEVVKRRKWVVIATLICFLTTVGIGTYLMQPVYRASARLKVGSEDQLSPTLGRGMGYGWESEYSQAISFKTHSQMIRSFPVLYRAAKSLKLNEMKRGKRNSAFKDAIRKNLEKIKGWFSSPLSALTSEKNSEAEPSGPAEDP